MAKLLHDCLQTLVLQSFLGLLLVHKLLENIRAKAHIVLSFCLRLVQLGAYTESVARMTLVNFDVESSFPGLIEALRLEKRENREREAGIHGPILYSLLKQGHEVFKIGELEMRLVNEVHVKLLLVRPKYLRIWVYMGVGAVKMRVYLKVSGSVRGERGKGFDYVTNNARSINH